MMRRIGAPVYGVMIVLACCVGGCSNGSAQLTELQKVRSGMLEVVLLSPRDALRHGKDDFIIEFRGADGKLVDVGVVRASASMSMSGVPMLGSITVQPTGVAGRYRADGDFSMAGTWRVAIEWDGSAGKGSVSFSGTVQ
jgi:hypothetical protein